MDQRVTAQQKFLERLDHLEDLGKKVVASARHGQHVARVYDDQLAYEWLAGGQSLLERIFGFDSTNARLFAEPFQKLNTTSGRDLGRALGVLRSARSEVEGGYLFNTRVLIEAEVFSDFLEQAEHLLERNYYQAAAVLAGGVLEDAIRKLCERNDIAIPEKATIDPLNVELAKKGIYSTLEQKRVTALADIRNKAAHAKWDEFSQGDVEGMLRDVTRFVADYAS